MTRAENREDFEEKLEKLKMNAEDLMDIVNTVSNKISEDISVSDLTEMIDLYIINSGYYYITEDELDSVCEEIVDKLDDEDIKVF